MFIPVCLGGDIGPPGKLAGTAELGATRAAHSLTRGHNRKVVYDATHGHWYVFWLRNDGEPTYDAETEGVVYQASSDGLTWTEPVVVEPGQLGGITAWDVIRHDGRLFLLGLTKHPDPAEGTIKYAVRELGINPDGSLTIGAPQVVHDNSGGDSTTVHFYGSLLRDGEGYFWVAARVGDSSPNTHADVIRSTQPDSILAWGPSGAVGPAANGEWVDPYAKSERSMLRGTIANRLLDLGPHGVGLITYNKADGREAAPAGRILFVRNPTRTHDGWEPTSLVLTERANQFIRQGSRAGADPSRLDDRRFAAVVDPATQIIHVAYVAGDSDGPDNAVLRYFTLAPPYGMADKSDETVLVNAEVDGVHLSMDTRTSAATLYLFYVANDTVTNDDPRFQVRMVRNTGTGWSDPLNISEGKGVVRYPQPPERTGGDEIVVAYQTSERMPEGHYLYHIRVGKVLAAPVPATAE
jgi:hypothetical protein